MKSFTTFVLIFSVTFFYISLSQASSGDRAPEFKSCLSNCISTTCNEPKDLALALRLTHWTCADDCSYHCMHAITDDAALKKENIKQYYGKWPFWRWSGMQEPASVLFSLLNLWAHKRGYNLVKRRVPDIHPMKKMLLAWSIVSMNAWVFSAVFHTRDWPSTEKLDYFSAAAVFVTALYMVVVRFFLLGRPSRRMLYGLWRIICVLAFVLHVSYLTFSPRFDYSYNIIFNLIIGLIHNALWILYALPSSMTIIRRYPPSNMPGAARRSYRPRCASQVAICVAMTMAAMSLELLDFPPIARILDAHALWHAATIPIAVLWYRFLVNDALDEGWHLR